MSDMQMDEPILEGTEIPEYLTQEQANQYLQDFYKDAYYFASFFISERVLDAENETIALKALYKAVKTFNPTKSDNFRSYLRSTVRNACIDRFRATTVRNTTDAEVAPQLKMLVFESFDDCGINLAETVAEPPVSDQTGNAFREDLWASLNPTQQNLLEILENKEYYLDLYNQTASKPVKKLSQDLMAKMLGFKNKASVAQNIGIIRSLAAKKLLRNKVNEG